MYTHLYLSPSIRYVEYWSHLSNIYSLFIIVYSCSSSLLIPLPHSALALFQQCYCALNADPSQPPVIAAGPAGSCKHCKTQCDCGCPWGEYFDDDGTVYIVSLTFCRFADSEGAQYRIRKQRCSNLDCSQIKTPSGLEHGLLCLSSPLAKVTCFYSLDLLYRIQLDRMVGQSVTEVWRTISVAHKTVYLDSSSRSCNLSRHMMRRALITFTNSQCLPSEATFSCVECGDNPRSVHCDGLRMGPNSYLLRYPKDMRTTVFAKFSEVARPQVTFFPTLDARNAAKKLVSALTLDIESAVVYAAAVFTAASHPILTATASPLLELCESLRAFVSPLDSSVASLFAEKVFRDAVILFLNSLTSGAAVPSAFNTGLSALSLKTWGTDPLSHVNESRERAVLLGIYPQLSMLMTSITTLPTFLYPIVNRLRDIETAVATAVIERNPDWLPDGVSWERVSAEIDRQYGYMCPPSMRWQTSKIVVFTANGLAPSTPRIPLVTIKKKSKPKGFKNDGVEDLIHCFESPEGEIWVIVCQTHTHTHIHTHTHTHTHTQAILTICWRTQTHPAAISSFCPVVTASSLL